MNTFEQQLILSKMRFGKGWKFAYRNLDTIAAVSYADNIFMKGHHVAIFRDMNAHFIWYSEVISTDPIDEKGMKARYLNFLRVKLKEAEPSGRPTQGPPPIRYGDQPLQKRPGPAMFGGYGKYTKKALSTPASESGSGG